jgi:hypothetical protein
VRIDLPLCCVRPHQPDCLLHIPGRIARNIVSVAVQTVAKNDGVDAVVVKERNEVRALAPYVERPVPTAGNKDHRRTGIQPTIHGVYFNRRIVDVDNAVDSARRVFA